MKNHYLIDYENVKEKGLEGIFRLLPENSMVYIFYTKNANTVKMELFMDSFENKAEVPLKAYYIKAGKQSLDMQLVSFLGYLIGSEPDGENRYLIISRDSDFVNTVSFWQDNFGNSRVEQYPTIDAALYFMSEAKEEAESEEAGESEPVIMNAKSLLNNAIQTALSKNRVEGSKIPKIASMVVAFCKEENHKEIIMECLVKKYGSKEAYQLFPIIEPLL